MALRCCPKCEEAFIENSANLNVDVVNDIFKCYS